MQTPDVVARRVSAMKEAVSVPVTVKCRIGVDEQDVEVALDTLADMTLDAGADALWVHARKAWLKGLSPKENREIPPLDYDRVYRLKARLRDVFVGINAPLITILNFWQRWMCAFMAANSATPRWQPSSTRCALILIAISRRAAGCPM